MSDGSRYCEIEVEEWNDSSSQGDSRDWLLVFAPGKGEAQDVESEVVKIGFRGKRPGGLWRYSRRDDVESLEEKDFCSAKLDKCSVISRWRSGLKRWAVER